MDKMILKEKERKIQAKLDVWAKKTDISPGQRVVVSLRVESAPKVIPKVRHSSKKRQELLGMRVSDFFTLERLEKEARTRTLAVWARNRILEQAPPKRRKYLMSDFLSQFPSRAKILAISKVKETLGGLIIDTLERAGLPLKEK
jgi:hypothetical protein